SEFWQLWRMVDGEEWSQQALIDVGVEDSHSDAVSREQVGVGVWKSLDQALTSKGAQVIGHLWCGVLGGEEAGDLARRLRLVKPATALIAMHKAPTGASCADPRCAKLRFVGPPEAIGEAQSPPGLQSVHGAAARPGDAARRDDRHIRRAQPHTL